ncbi:TIGR04190 family B12-binding domain/radical SAM domain protein [Alicyclobacillaceae bacterium I2511]|nr:TIGR04190 family B12-binding domain/radical SAM domain protein [Alicyclobacillaceae bacterium I2511]
MKYDLVFLHAPSVYDFRQKVQFTGPVSDVIPSTSVFEMYPIGLTSMAGYLERAGYRVRIVNLANRMLQSSRFNAESKVRKLHANAFGIDLHWLPHAHGSIEIAKLVKKYHPDTPVIFGGLSATYYHEELMQYDCVDFVLRGDSTEKPLMLLMEQIEAGQTDFSTVPNLTWKRADGQVVVNPLSYVPDTLDDVDVPDYRYTVRSVFKYLNFLDPLPYKGWLKYPNTALLTARGCTQGCLICGGSRNAYALNCQRHQLAMRSPKKLVEDILFIQRFSRAPIFMLHDIRQGGQAYVDELLGLLKGIKLKNELVFEVFQYADDEFFAKVEAAVPKFSLEITLETYEERLRRLNGKFISSNDKLIDTLQSALRHSCRKIDLFFMVGLPHQSYESALGNVEFCEEIHNRCGQDRRLSYFVAPLAPFLDPASSAFESPEVYGYHKFCKSFEDCRQLLLEPSWKHTLSYETDLLSRDDIVRATYESAHNLNEFKHRYHLVSEVAYQDVAGKIQQSLAYIKAVDDIKERPLQDQTALLKKLQDELAQTNGYEICGEHELRWEVRNNYANFFSLFVVGMELLWEELRIARKTRLGTAKERSRELPDRIEQQTTV